MLCPLFFWGKIWLITLAINADIFRGGISVSDSDPIPNEIDLAHQNTHVSSNTEPNNRLTTPCIDDRLSDAVTTPLTRFTESVTEDKLTVTDDEMADPNLMDESGKSKCFFKF